MRASIHASKWALMAVTIHLDRDQAVLRAVVSPLAELGAALHLVTAPDHHVGLAPWIERVNATFTPRMHAELSAFQFLWDTFRATFLFPIDPGDHGVTATLTSELAQLLAMPLGAFATQALQPLTSRPDLPLDEAPTDSADRLLSHARARNRWVEATTSALLSNPDQVRQHLVEFLTGCGEVFFDVEWERMAPTLERAAADVRALQRTRPTAAIVMGLAHGIHVRRHTVTIDKSVSTTIHLETDQRLLVVPSLLCHPHVLVQSEADQAPVIQYPLQRQAPQRALPPLPVTARRLEALADPSRLELCGLIAREARATQELAAMTGLTAPTVSRHLKLLRDAGVVTSSQHGHFRMHELDLEVVESLGQALVASLLR